MAKGDGSIIARGRGVWEVQLSLGKDPITEKYHKATRVVHGTKADARKVRDQMRQERDGGLSVEGDKLTFAEFCVIYIKTRRAAAKVKQETIDQDEKRLRFVCKFIGQTPLRKIDAQTIEALYPAIREERHSQGYGCGNTTLHAYHVLLKAVFKKAVKYRYIMRNPCEDVDAPKIDKPSRNSLTATEAARLLECVNAAEDAALSDLQAKELRRTKRGNLEERSYLRSIREVCCVLAVRIGLATGMRVGEVLRLSWDDVNFPDRRLTIGVSKTDAGRRVVALDADTTKHLRQWKDLQCGLLSTVGIEQHGSSPVLCSSTGGRINVQNFENWWRTWRKKNGFNSLKFHELRHTQATQLLANGVDVKTVQARLGHSDASITLNWYGHAVPENDEAAADLIGELFSKKPSECRFIELKTA